MMTRSKPRPTGPLSRPRPQAGRPPWRHAGATGRALVFNATGPAPLAATPERYAGGIPRTGPMSVSVPGLIAGIGAMHRQFGRLPWRACYVMAKPNTLKSRRDVDGREAALRGRPRRETKPNSGDGRRWLETE
jgi:hypothetical protein